MTKVAVAVFVAAVIASGAPPFALALLVIGLAIWWWYL
jgi:hypothetical protein